MDLLTLLDYPVVFVHNKLRQFTKSKTSLSLPNLLVSVLAGLVAMTNRNLLNMQKKGNYAY